MRRNPAKNKGFPSGKPLFFSGCSGRDRTCDQVINSQNNVPYATLSYELRWVNGGYFFNISQTFYLSLTIYFQWQYGQIFLGETVEMPCDTAYDINAQDDSANMGIAIIIPMPVKPITVPIIDNIIPKNKEPQPYD